jgi:hypothetical protein
MNKTAPPSSAESTCTAAATSLGVNLRGDSNFGSGVEYLATASTGGAKGKADEATDQNESSGPASPRPQQGPGHDDVVTTGEISPAPLPLSPCYRQFRSTCTAEWCTAVLGGEKALRAAALDAGVGGNGSLLLLIYDSRANLMSGAISSFTDPALTREGPKRGLGSKREGNHSRNREVILKPLLQDSKGLWQPADKLPTSQQVLDLWQLLSDPDGRQAVTRHALEDPLIPPLVMENSVDGGIIKQDR